MAANSPKNVDDYLAAVSSDEARESLIHLRETIRKAIPEAEEVIAYGIPTYKLHGHVTSFAAYKKHCSFFPGHTVADFSEQLKGHKVLKGTVQFPHDCPLPDELVIAMVKTRAAENQATGS